VLEEELLVVPAPPAPLVPLVELVLAVVVTPLLVAVDVALLAVVVEPLEALVAALLDDSDEDVLVASCGDELHAATTVPAKSAQPMRNVMGAELARTNTCA
jgi:hypothetical protein